MTINETSFHARRGRHTRPNLTTPLPCPVAALKANDLSLLAPEPGVRGCWPPSAALRGEREEFQRDVVRITEGQRRAVSSIDDTAVGDTESV
jgi:hypothetical protein